MDISVVDLYNQELLRLSLTLSMTHVTSEVIVKHPHPTTRVTKVKIECQTVIKSTGMKCTNPAKFLVNGDKCVCGVHNK
jgi:predicted thioesterase